MKKLVPVFCAGALLFSLAACVGGETPTGSASGSPDPQKEEFHVYDAGELAATILDSIQHTLQYNFVDPEKGEPSSLDIYYCDAAGESITIPGLDVTIPMDTPYSGLAMA